MSSHDSQRSDFQLLITRVSEGSQEALWELVTTYGPHISRFVRRHLPQEMRGKFDSDDFVQAVWKSFFARPRQIREFATPEQLMAFLASVARNKVIQEFRRRMRTRRYDVRRETSLDDTTTNLRERLVGRTPTASEFAIARERWERLVEQQPPRCQRMVRMRFMGATYAEIADAENVNERTVRRTFQNLLRVHADV